MKGQDFEEHIDEPAKSERKRSREELQKYIKDNLVLPVVNPYSKQYIDGIIELIQRKKEVFRGQTDKKD